MTARFKRTPKKSQPIDVSFDAGIFTLETRTRTACRFSVELPGAPHNLTIEMSKSLWRVLSQTLRFCNNGQKDLRLAVRHVELASFESRLTDISALSEADLVAQFQEEFKLGCCQIEIRVENGTLEEMRELVKAISHIHDKRVSISSMTPLNRHIMVRATSHNNHSRDEPRSKAVVRLLEAAAEYFMPFGQVVYATSHGTAHRMPRDTSGVRTGSLSAHEELGVFKIVTDFVDRLPEFIRSKYNLGESLVDDILARQ